MSSTVIEDNVFEYEPFEEDGSVLMVAESLWRGFATELQELHSLKGAQFINQLKLIVSEGEFHLVKGEDHIFSAINEQSDDFDNLINAARKAVTHGYCVYILPNPRNCRTADFIFRKKTSYMMYDLKTVSGMGSVETQLLDSIGQSNRILLNISSDYNARLLAADIKSYFEFNRNAVEVLIFKGKKMVSVNRYTVQSPMFHRQFRKIYEK
ncbi:MAG: hypothetical protein IJQ59_04360 [Bacteroidaceae bacterium]|nr:hypothetical protein [Bacteroidaceae bacterium]